MELINHEIVKLRRDISGLVPREIGFANDAFAGKRRLQFARVRVAFRAFAAVAHNVEHVAMAVANTGNETQPVAVLVAIEQAGIIALTIVEIADDMHRTCIGRPDAKCGAIGDEVRAHRGVERDVVE